MSDTPSCPLARSARSESSFVEMKDPHIYPSLQQSLCASRPKANRLRSLSDPGNTPISSEGKSQQQYDWSEDLPQSPEPSTVPSSGAADIAFAVLQYLPTPILVLSASKTIILANEAMCSLLAQEAFTDPNELDVNSQRPHLNMNVLQDRSLSQVGMEIIRPMGLKRHISWEVHLQ